MLLKQGIILGVAFASFGLLAGCYNVSEEGCQTCPGYSRVWKNADHCQNQADLTCWASCNSCHAAKRGHQKGLWNTERVDHCRDYCCSVANTCRTIKTVYKD